MKVTLLPADEAAGLLEDLIAQRNPELGERRAESHAKLLAAAEKNGEPVDPERLLVGLEAVLLGSPALRSDGITYPGSPPAVDVLGLNRDIVEGRVAEYVEAMLGNRWWFTPDPIVVSDDGRVLNGQHRLLAAGARIFWDADEGDTIPTFVLIEGVDKKAALLMDEARRSTADRRNIAVRFAEAVAS